MCCHPLRFFLHVGMLVLTLCINETWTEEGGGAHLLQGVRVCLDAELMQAQDMVMSTRNGMWSELPGN